MCVCVCVCVCVCACVLYYRKVCEVVRTEPLQLELSLFVFPSSGAVSTRHKYKTRRWSDTSAPLGKVFVQEGTMFIWSILGCLFYWPLSPFLCSQHCCVEILCPVRRSWGHVSPRGQFAVTFLIQGDTQKRELLEKKTPTNLKKSNNNKIYWQKLNHYNLPFFKRH